MTPKETFLERFAKVRVTKLKRQGESCEIVFRTREDLHTIADVAIDMLMYKGIPCTLQIIRKPNEDYTAQRGIIRVQRV